MLGHKTNLNKFKRVKIAPNMFFKCNGMKLEINSWKIIKTCACTFFSGNIYQTISFLSALENKDLFDVGPSLKNLILK